METAIGTVVISYQVDCPHCGETNYSDADYKQWVNLEWGDGHPHGNICCIECDKEFYLEIES